MKYPERKNDSRQQIFPPQDDLRVRTFVVPDDLIGQPYPPSSLTVNELQPTSDETQTVPAAEVEDDVVRLNPDEDSMESRG